MTKMVRIGLFMGDRIKRKNQMFLYYIRILEVIYLYTFLGTNRNLLKV